MLNKRYNYDGIPLVKLSPLQIKTKEQIEAKVRSGQYKIEKIQCVICGGSNFEQLSEKDRFGLNVSVVICRDCGLIQTNPRLTQGSYNEFYINEHIKLIFGQERATKDLFLDEYFHGQKIYKYLEKNFSKKPEEMFILEIGCGAGGIIAYFRDKGCSVKGMDLDGDCIEFGKQNYNLDLQTGSLKDFKADKKPDVIILSHILEHFLKPDEELSIMRAILHSQGMIYIEVPGARNMFFIHNDLNFLRYLQIAHTYHYSLTTLKNLLNKTGFEMIHGDERVRSVFKQGEKVNIYENNYESLLMFLKRLEVLRKCLPITPFKIRFVIESACCWILEKTKLYNNARKIYRKIIDRVEPKANT